MLWRVSSLYARETVLTRTPLVRCQAVAVMHLRQDSPSDRPGSGLWRGSGVFDGFGWIGQLLMWGCGIHSAAGRTPLSFFLARLLRGTLGELTVSCLGDATVMSGLRQFDGCAQWSLAHEKGALRPREIGLSRTRWYLGVKRSLVRIQSPRI
jgi:hypothetical protein